jgi:hypothetical protein
MFAFGHYLCNVVGYLTSGKPVYVIVVAAFKVFDDALSMLVDKFINVLIWHLKVIDGFFYFIVVNTAICVC